MKQITIDNVADLLADIGLSCRHEPVGAGWHRAYMFVPGKDGVPLQFGRVMFQHGVFSHVKWYSAPDSGDIQEWDIYWFNWVLYTLIDTTLSPADWEQLKHDANVRATAKHQTAVNNRRQLNSDRKAAGKKPRTNALAQVNQRGAARTIVREWVEKRLGHPVWLPT